MEFFFNATGWAFWSVVLLVCLIEFALAGANENDAETHGFANLLWTAFLVLVLFGTWQNVTLYHLVLTVGVYVLAGVVWSFFEWPRYVRRMKARAVEKYD